jgi:hypothetical protein
MARREAESLMDTTVLIRRTAGESFDEATGTYVPAWDVIYEGPARIRFARSALKEVDGAGQRLAEQSPSVSLPIGANRRITAGTSADVRVDDVGEVTLNPDDPGIVGLRFRVSGQHSQTHSSARRLPVEVAAHA